MRTYNLACKRVIDLTMIYCKILGSSNCARETYLLRVKRTYSVANSNATCVIFYMRAKIDLQDLLTMWEVLPVVFA